MGMRTQVVASLLGGLAALLVGATVRAQEPDDITPKVTAAFVLNFAKYTDWPATAFEGPEDPIVISVVADENVARLLAALVRNERRDGRSFQVRLAVPPVSVDKVDGSDPADDEARANYRLQLRKSHIVFVGAQHQHLSRWLLDQLKGSDVLTIGFADGFARAGGMLGLKVRDERIVFEANPDAIHRTALAVSSKVLRLAEIVRDDHE